TTSLAGTSTTPTQVPSRTEENQYAAKPARTYNGYVINGQTVGAPPAQTQLPEQELSGQSVAQEALGTGLAPGLAESSPAPVKASGSDQERRRRHGQDRQRGKEQSAATPVGPVANVAPVMAPSLAGTPTVPEA